MGAGGTSVRLEHGGRWGGRGAVVRLGIGLLLASNSFALAISQFSLKLDSTNTDASPLSVLSSENFQIQCRIAL